MWCNVCTPGGSQDEETGQRQRKELVAKLGKAEIEPRFSPKFKLISKTEAHPDWERCYSPMCLWLQPELKWDGEKGWLAKMLCSKLSSRNSAHAKVPLDRWIPTWLIPSVFTCFYMLSDIQMSQPHSPRCPMGQQNTAGLGTVFPA